MPAARPPPPEPPKPEPELDDIDLSTSVTDVKDEQPSPGKENIILGGAHVKS